MSKSGKSGRLKVPRICQDPFCGRVFFPYSGPHHNNQRYCSGKCYGLKGIIRSAINEARQSLKNEVRELWREIHKAQVTDTERRKSHRKAGRKCGLCGEWFLLKTEYKTTHTGRKSKYCPNCAGISDRLDKFGVAYEAVNPITVFGRDGWRCQHCGYSTPEWLRGPGWTDLNPTLDHILPVAKGGAHSYANTQCLCSDCNNNKRDQIDKEPRLAKVMDFSPFMVAKVPAHIQRDPHTLEIIIRGKVQKAERKNCACNCGETFTPFVDGNADYKMGHWSRVQPSSGVYPGCFSAWPPTTAKQLMIKRSLHLALPASHIQPSFDDLFQS